MRYPVGKDHEDYKSRWYSASHWDEWRGTYFHGGEDFNLLTGGDTDLGRPIYCIADGEVTSVHEHTTKPTFGKHIHIKHIGTWGTVYSHYAHCESILVKVGDVVKEGQIIAKLGKSGTDIPHLHFEIKLQPTGIDGIAKTKEDLKKWTDPIAFVEKYRSIINPPMDSDIRIKLLDENGIKTEGQTREAIDHHKGWDSLQKDLKSSKDTIEQQKTSIDALVKSKEDLVAEIVKVTSEAKLWKEKHESFVATIAKALGTTQDEARIIPAINDLIAKADKVNDIVDERPVISATPIHKLLEEILQYLKKLIVTKENGNKE